MESLILLGETASRDNSKPAERQTHETKREVWAWLYPAITRFLVECGASVWDSAGVYGLP